MLKRVNQLKTASISFVKLSDNPVHEFASRHALSHYASNSVYTFIPKNGCTTMRYSLARANGCIENEENFDWIHHNNQTFKASLKELVTADYTFVILRCPFRRLASFFLDKVVRSVAPATQLLKFLDGSKVKATDLASLTFTELVTLLEDEAIRTANNHWCNQSNFLIYQTYSDYFALERFTDAVTTLRNKTGLEIFDARKLSNHGLDSYVKVADIDCSELSAAHISQMMQQGKAPAYQSLYNAGLVARVRSIFANDLALYTSLFGTADLLFH